jgi:WD40 repeat protein
MKKIVADCEKYEDIRLTDIDTGNEKVLIPKVNSVFSTVFFINSTQFILGTFKNEKYFGGKRGRLIKYDISNDRITEFPIPIEYQFGICGDLALSPSRRLMVVRYDLNSPFAIYDTRSCSLLKISKTHAYYSAFCFNSKDNQIALSDKNNIYTVDIETLKFTKIFTIPKKEVIYNIEYQDDLTIVIKSSVPAGYPKNIRFVDIRTKSLKRILKPDMNGQLYVTNEYLIFESL